MSLIYLFVLSKNKKRRRNTVENTQTKSETRFYNKSFSYIFYMAVEIKVDVFG